MRLPFTSSEFLEVFRRYNEATWPAAIVLPFLGLACAWLLQSERSSARRAALVILGSLWAWTAVAYHHVFFAPINPAAELFALLALAQAVMFLYASVGGLNPPPRYVDADRIVGGAIIAFALVLYPALGYLAGHRYPRMPTFGLPCPTTIFTIGVLATLHEELSWKYAIIPLLWVVVGTSAAMQLGMVEDLSLPLAAVAMIVLMASHRVKAGRGRRTHAAGGAG